MIILIRYVYPAVGNFLDITKVGTLSQYIKHVIVTVRDVNAF
jgi:hypothetical protein